MNLRSRRGTASRLSSWTTALLLGALLPIRASYGGPTWGGHAGNPQHTAVSSVASRSLVQILWQTPVDLKPQYNGSALYIHYGSPLVSAANTLVIAVKVGAADSFRVEARNGADGSLLWQYDTDYTLPAHNWIPSYGPVLTPSGRLYMPGAGGTLLYTDDVDIPGVLSPTRIAFYGIDDYNSDPAAFNADIRVCTPLTSDSQGNVFFGYRATGSNPLAIEAGIARIGSDGSTSFVSALTATGGLGSAVALNCAPALSNDDQTLYLGIRRPGSFNGYLVALDATTLSPRTQVLLLDPSSGTMANLYSDGTASPMVAPDGKVYYGVLENPFLSNADRGWLLQFDANLTPAGPPGAFGWDDTPSLVPTSMVPSYHGGSTYLLMTKYNYYAGIGGNGVNKLAILDPNDSQIDSHAGATVMKEILTIAGVTPDSAYIASYPDAVREWCINTAVVDPATHSVLAGSEDGRLYRWDLTTNTFTESITLTPGIGEAYTPTLIGQDGTVYAINNATLFAVGDPVPSASPGGASRTLGLAVARPNPFASVTSLRFALPRAEYVKLEILDATGRRVAGLAEAELSAGDHTVHWAGQDAQGRRLAAGVYFARLTAGSRTATQKLVLTR